MGRWTQHDEDGARLPSGMTRVGYDADTRRYTFQDHNGVLYQSEPGNTYGNLVPKERAAEISIQRARPHAFESSNPEKQRTALRTNSKLNSFEEFLPPHAITSPPSASPPSTLQSILSTSPTSTSASLKAAFSTRGPSSNDTRGRSSSHSPSPSPTKSHLPPTRWLTQRRRNQTSEPKEGGEESRGLLRSLTFSSRSSVKSSGRRSPQSFLSRASSRASRASTSTTSTITPATAK